jgi:hypothetical protein
MGYGRVRAGTRIRAGPRSTRPMVATGLDTPAGKPGKTTDSFNRGPPVARLPHRFAGPVRTQGPAPEASLSRCPMCGLPPGDDQRSAAPRGPGPEGSHAPRWRRSSTRPPARACATPPPRAPTTTASSPWPWRWSGPARAWPPRSWSTTPGDAPATPRESAGRYFARRRADPEWGWEPARLGRPRRARASARPLLSRPSFPPKPMGIHRIAGSNHQTVDYARASPLSRAQTSDTRSWPRPQTSAERDGRLSLPTREPS